MCLLILSSCNGTHKSSFPVEIVVICSYALANKAGMQSLDGLKSSRLKETDQAHDVLPDSLFDGIKPSSVLCHHFLSKVLLF